MRFPLWWEKADVDMILTSSRALCFSFGFIVSGRKSDKRQAGHEGCADEETLSSMISDSFGGELTPQKHY